MAVIFSRGFCKQSCYSYRRLLTSPEQIFWQRIDSWPAWAKHFEKCCVLTQSKVFYIVDKLSSFSLQKSEFCVPRRILCVLLAGICEYSSNQLILTHFKSLLYAAVGLRAAPSNDTLGIKMFSLQEWLCISQATNAHCFPSCFPWEREPLEEGKNYPEGGT